MWNACRPDGYIELAFDRREERQVAKVQRDPILRESPRKTVPGFFRKVGFAENARHGIVATP